MSSPHIDPAILVLAPEGGGAELVARALSGHPRPGAVEHAAGAVEQVDELAARFPDAKVVHVVRDPRAIVLQRAGGDNRRLGELAGLWLRETAALLRVGAAEPRRVVRLPYESLLSDPRGACERLCRALDLPSEPDAMAAALRAGLSAEEEYVFQPSALEDAALLELERSLQPILALLGFRPATLPADRAVPPVDDVARLRRERDRYADELEQLRRRVADDSQLPFDIDVLRWKAKRYDRLRAAATPLRLLKRLRARLRS